MKTFKGMEGGLPKRLKPYDCNGKSTPYTKSKPKPYTKSTLTNKSQAKRKRMKEYIPEQIQMAMET